MKTTSEMNHDLDEMAHELCYYSIRWSDLFKQLDNAAWGALAERMVPQVRAKVDEIINAEFTRIESERDSGQLDS
jgi:hypothetical protein